jgi:TonB-dependent receptor
MDWAAGKWRLIGGVRFEDSKIEVTTLNRYHPDTPPIVTEVDDRDWLPSLSVVYQVGEAANLRFSASRTVNRPEFRELAPFTFVSLAGGFEVKGNSDLVSAKITSYDARWEWFPNASDVVAFSVFAKSFDNPIEQVLIQSVARTQTFQNAEKAENLGVEVEFRRNLGVLFPALDNFNVILNYAYIDSEITLADEIGSAVTNKKRPLVGQPDQVANVVLEWLRPEWGSSIRLLYNHSGETVAFAGANYLPDVLEEPRETLDLAYRQAFELFGQRWSLKVSAENLTDHEWKYTQGGEIWRLYQPGRKIGFSLGLTLS